MEKTFIIGNSSNAEELAKVITAKVITLESLNNDIEIHDWVKKTFENNDIERLLIEFDDDYVMSIKIALHIRLSIDELREKSLIPIMFVSNTSISEVITDKNVQEWGHIFLSKGIYFSSYEEAKEEVKHIKAIERVDEYKTRFLNIIKILGDEKGRHSIANIFGAYAMDKAANTNTLQSDDEFKKLYLKFVTAANKTNKLKKHLPSLTEKGSKRDPNTIDARDTGGKRILLIDDEADKGWEKVLKKVFKTSKDEDFVVIKEKIKNYGEFSDKNRTIIEDGKFDLYLLDLRLNGSDEKSTKIKEFSGMKILEKIKYINEGNQVIMFTASNKAWNMKELLDAGADGYYIKESPEYNFSPKVSKQNYEKFKETVKECFDRGYLRDIWSKIKEIEEKLKKL